MEISICGSYMIGVMTSLIKRKTRSMKESAIRRILAPKVQILEAIEFAEKWNLSQKIKNPTRENNILDLLLTSDDLVSDIKHEHHAHISDHDTLIVRVDMEISLACRLAIGCTLRQIFSSSVKV